MYYLLNVNNFSVDSLFPTSVVEIQEKKYVDWPYANVPHRPDKGLIYSAGTQGGSYGVCCCACDPPFCRPFSKQTTYNRLQKRHDNLVSSLI